jgi:hypothetical protein
MPQSEFVVLAIVLAFLLFITARGELAGYIRLLV